MENIDSKIIDFINKHHVLTIATSHNNQPYCANCFYKYDSDKNYFIFTSDLSTRHIKEAIENPKVAASIVLETETIGKIQGLQICGELILLENEELKYANKVYLKRFPYAILKDTPLWALKPNYFKLTHNILGFGKKLIWNL